MVIDDIALMQLLDKHSCPEALVIKFTQAWYANSGQQINPSAYLSLSFFKFSLSLFLSLRLSLFVVTVFLSLSLCLSGCLYLFFSFSFFIFRSFLAWQKLSTCQKQMKVL